ncbi:unnamed protein product [Coregonus sp. 'balchen']|nr:unnamed protein product [Coregonus sp. 'balchen']
MKTVALLAWACCWINVCTSAQGRYAQKLLNDLMESYSSALRPVEDTDKTLNVTLQITLSQIKDMIREDSLQDHLSQIKDMDERNQVLTTYLWIRQTWFDAYLKWDKEEYDGLEITWDMPAITKSSCVVDVSYFPFDWQWCNLTFGSWTYNGNQVDIAMGDGTVVYPCVCLQVDIAMGDGQCVYPVCRLPGGHSHGGWTGVYPGVCLQVDIAMGDGQCVYPVDIAMGMDGQWGPVRLCGETPGSTCPLTQGEKVLWGVDGYTALKKKKTVFKLMVAEMETPQRVVPIIGDRENTTSTTRRDHGYTSLTIFIMNIHSRGAEPNCSLNGPKVTKPVPQLAKEAKTVPHWATGRLVPARSSRGQGSQACSSTGPPVVHACSHCGQGRLAGSSNGPKVLIIDYMSKILFVYEVGENCTTPESERTPLYSEEPMSGNSALARNHYHDDLYHDSCCQDDYHHLNPYQYGNGHLQNQIHHSTHQNHLDNHRYANGGHHDNHYSNHSNQNHHSNPSQTSKGDSGQRTKTRDREKRPHGGYHTSGERREYKAPPPGNLQKRAGLKEPLN